MALVVICGQPCSGKSTAALCLADALKESETNPTVRIIDETSFHLDRNQSYANMPAEKNLRGVLRSEVDRSVSRDSVIIVDSLNSIKGYRYELWCLARAEGIRYCVLFCDVEETHCREWNGERREKGEPAYDDKIFEDLIRRFERPDRRNRWDSPLFELWPSKNRIDNSSEAILDAVSYLTKRVDSKSRDVKVLPDKKQYQHLVGKLIYLSHTRPDIAYAVGVISQFMHQPQKEHMEAATRVIRYLKGSSSRGVLFQKFGHLNIEGYTDADWAGNPNDRRSTSGFFTLVGGNLVTWRSKKQKVVALSSAEAEFRGIARGLAEILWLRKLMTELGFSSHRACRLMCDNRAAISISENPVQHDRTKHIEVDRHFIKEKIEAGIITLPYVKSSNQLADILTKAVPGPSFNQVLSKLSIGDLIT